MKRASYLFLLLLIKFSVQAQSVAINTDKSAANPSAMLDVKSNTKGLLIPRTSTISRLAITNPAKGLMLYDTTAGSFWFYNGTSWNSLSSGGATNYWTANGSNIYNNNSGNVGIGLINPLASLHIKNNSEALRMEGTRPYLSFYDNAANLKSFILKSDNDLYIGMPASNPTGIMQLALGIGPVITMLPSGNVGIGTVTPDEKLVVQTLNNSYGILHKGENGNILATRMGGTSAGIGTFSNTNMRIFAGGNSAMFINASNSYVGVGVDFPANKLQVGSIGNTGYSGNDFVFGNGTNALRMYQTSNVSLIASSADILFWPKEKAGNVGINCLFPPGNKLQVGDIGPAGYNGNDIAFGNGSQATAIIQTNTSSQFASNTDFVFLPRFGTGAGRVGINTNTPRAPLDIAGDAVVTRPDGYGVDYAFYALRYSNFSVDAAIGGTNQLNFQRVSIFADGRVVATEFDAYSDARIKDISGVSNTLKDLETINKLLITDYSMKDKVKFGNQQFKKIIAQEVEKVYPQVVLKHTDFIPNVYQPCSKIIKTAAGYLLSFYTSHNISKAAKKLQILIDGNGMQPFDIISIPSINEVIINATEIKGNKVFVYGEEVDDFRTVDYEGLTTLNISATQELSKLIVEQNVKIAALAQELMLLKQHITNAIVIKQ